MGAKYTKPQADAAKRHLNKLDVVTIKPPQGTKALYKEYAEKEGKSLTQFILDAVNTHIKNSPLQ